MWRAAALRSRQITHVRCHCGVSTATAASKAKLANALASGVCRCGRGCSGQDGSSARGSVKHATLRQCPSSVFSDAWRISASSFFRTRTKLPILSNYKDGRPDYNCDLLDMRQACSNIRLQDRRAPASGARRLLRRSHVEGKLGLNHSVE